MMGDPTSFPVLPLLSIYCGEKTLKVLPYDRKEMRALRGRGVHVKRGDVVMKTCGDDAVMPRWSERRRTTYDSFMVERGVILQLEKSYWDIRKALFKEIPHVDGVPQDHTFVSSISAPPGGSKGSVTWASQPAAIRGDPDEHIRKMRTCLWKCSPFFHLWKALYVLGAPLGASEMYGGINLPIFPKASTRYHYQWLTFMASRSLEDLLIGTGLAPAAAANPSLVDGYCRKWLADVRVQQSDLVKHNRDLRTLPELKRIFRPQRGVHPRIAREQGLGEWIEKILPPPEPLPLLLVNSPYDHDGSLRVSLKVATRNAMGKLRSLEFYYRTPHDVKTPAARLYLSKFVRKVGSSPGIPGTYADLSEDIARKLAVFLSSRSRLPEAQFVSDQTSFGLERSSPIRRRMIAPTKFVEA